MSLNGITSAALSTLQTNSAALRTVSDNIANVNTPGYTRRVVNLEAQTSGGILTGVDIASIERVVDKFLSSETLSSTASSSRFDAQNSIFNQLNGLLGKPGDANSLTASLANITNVLGQAALSPTASASQQSVLTAFQGLASTISNLSTSISGLRDQVDQQVSSNVSDVNALIKQVYDLNTQAKTALINGDSSSAILDQRDVALQNLSKLVGIRSIELPDGRVSVSTNDGVSLVGDTYAQLSYAPGASNGTYGAITSQDINPQSGQPIGQPQNIQSHIDSGQLKGLIDMRDGTLADLNQELGNLAETTANAYNTQNNANASFPPPTSLTGRNTGLVAGDALNFTGKTTIAVADANGNLVSRVDVDFDAGTLSVDGGAPAAFGNTVGGFTAALNGALGANGTASFVDGALTISATGTNGIITKDDPATPANRGASGFSQFFGLNDLFRSAVPTVKATGLSAGDAGGYAAGSSISMSLTGPNGEVAKTATVSIVAGMTIGNVVTALNTAMNGQAIFTLNGDGSISETQPTALSDFNLNVTADTTQRGTTGVSFTQLFGIGVNQTAQAALSFSVNPQLAASPQRLATAQPQITAATVAGGTVVTHGDNSGLVALENVGNTKQSFAAAGGIAAEVASLSDYGAAFYQDVATRATTATANQTAQDDRLQEAQSRQAATSGVNLDEELSKMMTYQQSYAAGARMLTVVQQLFTTLLQIQ
ncbi:MAG: flagellar hook-associated protein FlgK [Rhizomicrobium sp.]